jgi:hypothetical protein
MSFSVTATYSHRLRFSALIFRYDGRLLLPCAVGKNVGNIGPTSRAQRSLFQPTPVVVCYHRTTHFGCFCIPPSSRLSFWRRLAKISFFSIGIHFLRSFFHSKSLPDNTSGSILMVFSVHCPKFQTVKKWRWVAVGGGIRVFSAFFHFEYIYLATNL